MGKLALVLFICILPWGFWKMNFSGICWKQYRKDKKIFLYLLRRVYRKASLHTKWPWTVAGKLCNQLDTKPKSQTQASPIAWLGHGQASEQGSEPEKKGSNGQTPQTQQQKNVPSTARGKLERKRKTWSKSGAGTNCPRHSAPSKWTTWIHKNLIEHNILLKGTTNPPKLFKNRTWVHTYMVPKPKADEIYSSNNNLNV